MGVLLSAAAAGVEAHRWHEDLEEVMKLNYVKTVSVGCMIFSSHVQLMGTVQRWIA